MTGRASTSAGPGFGAFVISLDFELHWGVRDWCRPTDAYTANLLGARKAIPALLRLFERMGVAATWATVGFLFAGSRDELQRYLPTTRPRYADTRLFPYDEPVGPTEDEDPLHYGASLVAQIASAAGQEVGSQTFSHYYCSEPGQTLATFEADLAAAVAIARARGLELRSMVFPRNEVNPAYLATLRAHGLTCYRGNQPGRWYRGGAWHQQAKLHRRALRVVDAYLDIQGDGTAAWEDVVQADGLCNVPASRFLRPFDPRLRLAEGARLQRISRVMDRAARDHRIFHLWWHPHNFGRNLPQNLAFLEAVLARFARNRALHGMRSMTMADVAATATALIGADP